VVSFANAELFQQMVDLLPFGAYVVDTNRRILYWNHRAEHITGFLAQEIVGSVCSDDLLSHCSVDGKGICGCGECPLTRVIKDGQPSEDRLLLRHKLGHRVPVLVRALPLRDDHGHIAAVAEIFQEESAGSHAMRWVTENIDQINVELGLPSVTATRAQIQLSISGDSPHTVAFLIEIENLHQMSSHRGKEMGNAALRALAQTISRLLTVSHTLGAWSMRRLLLLVPNCNQELKETLRQNLEAAGSICGITWWGERVTYRVKVDAIELAAYSSFDSLLSALDAAPCGEEHGCS
jgi:GGDEF domain-containing protein